MIKMFIMIECNQCGGTFPEIVCQVNDTEVPVFRLYDVVLNLEDAGWLSQQSASVHTCYDCRHPDNPQQEDLEASCPF